jgi:hypothetical protein
VVKSPASGAGLRKAGVGSNPTAVSSNFYTIFDFPALPYYSNTATVTSSTECFAFTVDIE